MEIGENTMDHRKVLFIGIDAGTWDVLKPWAENGIMPTLHKLMTNGVYAVNESTIPPMTAPSWTSIFTGVNPGKHGIFDFVKLKNGSLIPVNSKDIKITTIYEILSLYDYKNIIMSLPISYPPKEPFKGIMISDFMYPSVDIYPVSKKEYIKNYKVIEDPFENKRDRIRKIEIAAKSKFDVAKKLLMNESWDFFVFYYKESDTIFHAFWKDIKNKNSVYYPDILNVFKMLDEFLNWILENILDKNTILFLVSDHGFGDVEYQVNLNMLFKKNRWLITTNKNMCNSRDLRIAENRNSDKNIIHIHPVILKIGRLPIIKAFGKYIIKGIMGAEISENSYIDYNSSKAFVTTMTSMGIYIKDEDLIEDVYLEVKNIKLKNKLIFNELLYSKDIYSGKHAQEAPKIYPISNCAIISQDLGRTKIITKYNPGGWHKSNGVFLAYGSDIDNKGYIGKINVYDIAPTILHIYGLGIPNYMDGRPLKIFKEGSSLKHRNFILVDGSHYSKKIEEIRIKKRISHLKKLNKF